MLVSSFILIFIGGFNACVDPYWLFWEFPVWESSPALDTKQRFYKPSQMILRNPEVIFIGSSRVNRGIKLDKNLFGKYVYNAGIPSLNIDEIYSILRSSTRLNTKLVVIGLDYWMFSESKNPLQELEKSGSIFNNLATALFSLDALKDSIAALKAFPTESFWTRNGYRHTSYRSGLQVEEMYQNYRKGLNEKIISMKKIQVLKKIIDFLKIKNIQIVLYISPLHIRTFQAYNQKKFNNFIFEVEALSRDFGIPLLNYSRSYFQNSSHLKNGSTEDWLDYSHFSPKIGEKIQNEVLEFVSPPSLQRHPQLKVKEEELIAKGEHL